MKAAPAQASPKTGPAKDDGFNGWAALESKDGIDTGPTALGRLFGENWSMFL